MDDDTPMLEQSLRSGQPLPRFMTTSMKKKWQVIVIGGSFLRGTEGPTFKEVFCLLGAQVKDVARQLSSLVCPSDYLSALAFSRGYRQSCDEKSKGDQKRL